MQSLKRRKDAINEFLVETDPVISDLHFKPAGVSRVFFGQYDAGQDIDNRFSIGGNKFYRIAYQVL